MQRFQKQSFVLTSHTCFKNVGVTRMYVVAGFCMLFDRGVNISIGSGLVLGSPRFPIPLALPDICKWTCSAGHFVYDAFSLLFCRPVFWLLENISQCLYWFKSCLDVFAAQNASNAFPYSFYIRNRRVCLWTFLGSWLRVCSV